MSSAGTLYFEGNPEFFRASRHTTSRLSTDGGGNLPPQHEPGREPPWDSRPKGSRYDVAIYGGLIWIAASAGIFLMSHAAGLMMLAGAATYALFYVAQHAISSRNARFHAEGETPSLMGKITEAAGVSVVAAYLSVPLAIGPLTQDLSKLDLASSESRPSMSFSDASFLKDPRLAPTPRP